MKTLLTLTLLPLAFAWLMSQDCLAQGDGAPYQEAQWDAFIKPYINGESIRQETLCTTAEGREVEMLRIGKGRFRMLVTARHQADDVIGNYVIEGFIDGVLSEEDRPWFLNRADVVVIPFVDKDGVEDRAPGIDYSSRYGEDEIPAAQAIKAFLKGNWEKWYPSMIVDLHANDARNTAKGASLVGRPYEALDVDTDWLWQQTSRFSKTLQGLVEGPLQHDPADNVAWNQGWNQERKRDEVSLVSWTSFMTSLRFATRLEVPPATTAEAARAFGRGLAKALRKDIEGRSEMVSGYHSELAGMGSRIILPNSYAQDLNKEFPVVVDLRGTMEFGAPRYALDNPDFPFIVLAPDSPAARWEYCTEALADLIDEVCAEYRVDKERIYLTGLSIGGFGTWEMAMQHPEKFAAVAPVAAVGYVKGLENIKELPVWAIHGSDDKSVGLAAHTETVDTLKELGGKVKFTVVEGLGHDAFRYAYHRPELYDWFLQHTNSGIRSVEQEFAGVETVTLGPMVALTSSSEGPDGEEALRRFCEEQKFGSDSGIRYFADKRFPHRNQRIIATDQFNAPEHIGFERIPETRYLTLPFPKNQPGSSVVQSQLRYYRHIAKLYRWMTINDIPLKPGQRLLFEFNSPTERTPIRVCLPISNTQEGEP